LTARYPTPARADIENPAVQGGLPHSEIHGSKLVRSSPWLIAAYHVLHRLSAPRHPPDALRSLDRSHYQCPSRCIQPSLGRPDADVIDKKDQFLCRICLNGNAVKPCRPRSAAAPSERGGQTNPYLHDVKDANGSRRIRNCFTGPQPLPTDPLTEWWSQTGSNRRPPACKAGALPTELWPRSERHPAMIQSDPSRRRQAQRAAVEAPTAVNPPGPERLVGLGRLELPTSRLSGVRSNHLSYRPERLENSCATRKKEKRRRRHPACWGLTGPDCSNDEPIGPDYPENPEGSSLERR
jgi:hypothetical protein